MHLFTLRGEKREKARFLSAGTAKLTSLHLRVAFDFHFSQMLLCSGGRWRDESSGHPFCIALSELELFSWRAFVFPLRHRRSHMHQSGVFLSVGQPLVLFKSTRKTSFRVSLPFCHPSAVLWSSAAEESLQTSAGSLCSASQSCFLFFFCWFPTVCTLHVYGGRNTLVFMGQLWFGPQGPPAPLWLCQKASWIYWPQLKNFYCIYSDLIFSIEDCKCFKLWEKKVFLYDWKTIVLYNNK